MEVVRLIQEWRGHPVGTIVKVNDDFANTLFQTDVAEKMETENNGAIKERLHRIVAERDKY